MSQTQRLSPFFQTHSQVKTFSQKSDKTRTQGFIMWPSNSQSPGTFDISNYADVSVIDGEYYVVFTKEYLAGLEIRFGDEIFPPVLYAPATVLNMSENTGIEGESYTFTLTCEDVPGQEFERIVATVQPKRHRCLAHTVSWTALCL